MTDPAPSRFSLEARVDLGKVSGTNMLDRSPVWRLVSVLCGDQVDGGTALGQDPLVDVATNPNDAVLDPARPGSNATIDRAFYFTMPGSNVQNALPDRNFWQDAADEVAQIPNCAIRPWQVPTHHLILISTNGLIPRLASSLDRMVSREHLQTIHVSK